MIAVVALGQLLVTRGIDLPVGSTIALSGVTGALKRKIEVVSKLETDCDRRRAFVTTPNASTFG